MSAGVPFGSQDGVRESPLTLTLPVTEHISLLDDDVPTPARAPVNGTTRKTGQDFKNVHARFRKGVSQS